MIRNLLVAAVALAAACSGPAPEADNRAAADPPPSAPAARPEPSRDTPPAAEARNSLSEAPFTATSAQGAAQVVQTYFALVEAGRYPDARRLWSDGGAASGATEADFAAGFRRYREYHAEVGAPGRIEGAAGSLYVEVPVRV